MSEETRATPEERPMFRHLVATRPPREGRSALSATAASVAFHGVLLAGLVWATMSVAQSETRARDEKMVLYTPVPDQPPPPQPMAPPPPAPAPVQRQVVAQVVTKLAAVTPPKVEAPDVKGFKTLAPPTITPPDIPPPSFNSAPVRETDYSGVGAEGGSAKGKVALGEQHSVTAEDISSAPTFTPFTVSPRLRNREEVARALQRNYPPMLKDAGVGGKVLVWFLIDENGKVRKYQVKESSGHEALDQAALKVADVMEFTPALNRDQKVAVWVALPIEFSVGAG